MADELRIPIPFYATDAYGLEATVDELVSSLNFALRRITVLEQQVAYLQLSAPRGIPKDTAPSSASTDPLLGPGDR